MRVTAFLYKEDLRLLRLMEGDGHLFYVETPYSVEFEIDGRWVSWTVPAMTPTDLASIPVVVPRWIVEKVDRHIEAAVVHDHLCIVRPWTSVVAAEVFFQAMKAAGVESWKREVMYRAVLLGGPKW